MNQVPIEYWNTGEAKWDSHAAFQTTNHWHVSSYEEKSCDLTTNSRDRCEHHRGRRS